jgi:acyl-CoA synthetase (AMP-forming)/AMP-acid ligase II
LVAAQENAGSVLADKSLASVVAFHVQVDPDRPAVIFAEPAEAEWTDSSVSYAEVDSGARGYADRLRESAEPGDRVLLVHSSPLEFVKAFLACGHAGLTPVPVPVPTGPGHHLAPATGIAIDSAARVVLADSGTLPAVAAWLRQDGLAHLAHLDLAGVPPATGAGPEAGGGASSAFRSYRFGRLRELRGVDIGHRDLLDNLQTVAGVFGLRPGDRVGGWLSAGSPGACANLVSLLLAPLYAGGTAVLMPTAEFCRRPVSWLGLLDRYGVLATAAPHVAYQLCPGLVTDEEVRGLDLSRVRVALDTGPCVDAATLSDFVARFAPAGLDPAALRVGYGRDELPLLVSTSSADPLATAIRVDAALLERDRLRPLPPDAAGTLLVSSGPVTDASVRIVGADGAALPDGQVGAVSVPVAAAAGRREFLRTGDLGARFGGQLYVIGRRDEALTVQSRRIFAAPIERAAAGLDPAFGSKSSVFTVPAPHNAVVLVQELGHAGRPTDPAQLAALARRVREELTRRLGVLVDNIVFVPAGEVRTGFGGRIRRAWMRELFMADALNVLYEDLAREIRWRYRDADN